MAYLILLNVCACAYHKNEKHQKYKHKEIHWSKNWMCSSHGREIKVSKNHTKLCVNTRKKSTVTIHVCAKYEISKLGEGKELNEKHDREGS